MLGTVAATTTGSRRRMQGVGPVEILASLLLALGAMVMLGWFLRVPTLVQVFPGLTSMVFNTALCFALMGGALLLSASAKTPKIPVARGLALVVLALAGLNLAQIVSGAALGINLHALHAWMLDGHPIPGQMSMPTTVELLLGSSGFLVLHSGRLGSAWIRHFGRSIAALMFGIAGMALIGYALKLNMLYSWYAFGFMALHTASGMLLLALALWFRQSQIERRQSVAIEDRILSLGAWTLALAALAAGLTGVLTLKDESERSLIEVLSTTHAARVDMVEMAIELRATRADLVASRPGLRGLLQTLGAAQRDGMPTPGTSPILDSLLPFGLSSVRLLSPADHLMVSAGFAGTGPEVSVGLGGELPGSPRLVAQGGRLLLKQRFAVVEDGRAVGTILTEQQMVQIERQMFEIVTETDRGLTELCGVAAQGPVCFPNRRHPRVYAPRVPAQALDSPVLLALGGTRGAGSFYTDDGNRSFAAYGPVGSSGLVGATSIDSAALFVTLRQRLTRGLVLMVALVVSGVLVLRRSIKPLTRALALAERRYRAVVDTLDEGVLLRDENCAVLASNPAAARNLGMTPAELDASVAGDPRWKMIYEDGSNCPRSDHPAPRAIRTRQGEAGRVVGVIDGVSGNLRWLEFNTRYVLDLGAPAVVVTFRDVTSRRLAQQRLAESESRYQLMVDQVVDYAILMLDAQGRVASWNRGAELLKGYAAEEIIGRHFECFFTAEDRAAGLPADDLQVAARTGRFEMEGWRLRKDGSRFWGQMVLTAVHDADGALMGFAKVTHDLSERRRAEQAVIEASRRVQAMISSSPFGIVATDLDGLIVAMNPAGERMVGYSREELVGKHTPAIYHDPEEIRTRARELSDETGNTIEPGLESFVYRVRLGLSEEREWTCVRKDGTRFPIQLAITALRDPEGRLVGFMGVAYDISERKRREDYTAHVATHDFLTGLPTRRLLGDRLDVSIQRARRYSTKVGVLMIDLDHFKRINDSLGHHVGDELLKAVAGRLVGCVRGSDTVARMGGDEFVMLLPDILSIVEAEQVAREVVQKISEAIGIGPHALHVSPSVGVAMYPDDGTDSSELLRNADAAMYVAKDAGRGCYRVFSRQMQRDADQRLLMENDLRAALQRDQLQVYYQPQVCLYSGRVIGMEALVRWTHPQRGAVSPTCFIPIAEETGLILALGEWVLRQACAGARRLQQSTGEPLTVSVNLSPRQFRAPELTTLIASALHDSGLAPHHLELEITEGMLMEDADGAIERLLGIRALGVRIAVDDFGTGYSSLSYITRFAIDTLKIDRSFIERMQKQNSDAAVVLTIIALSRSLGLRVVAEGVETPEQLGFLRAQAPVLPGVNPSAQGFGVQGFHFSPAQPEEAFVRSFEALRDASPACVRNPSGPRARTGPGTRQRI